MLVTPGSEMVNYIANSLPKKVKGELYSYYYLWLYSMHGN